MVLLVSRCCGDVRRASKRCALSAVGTQRCRRPATVSGAVPSLLFAAIRLECQLSEQPFERPLGSPERLSKINAFGAIDFRIQLRESALNEFADKSRVFERDFNIHLTSSSKIAASTYGHQA